MEQVDKTRRPSGHCWGYKPHIPKRRPKHPRIQAGRLRGDSVIRLQHLRPARSSRPPPTDQSEPVGQNDVALSGVTAAM